MNDHAPEWLGWFVANRGLPVVVTAYLGAEPFQHLELLGEDDVADWQDQFYRIAIDGHPPIAARVVSAHGDETYIDLDLSDVEASRPGRLHRLTRLRWQIVPPAARALARQIIHTTPTDDDAMRTAAQLIELFDEAQR